MRPNFFVGIRLQCQSFAEVIVDIQDRVIQRAPHLHKCRMDARKLHLTSFVLSLTDVEQVNKAVECLNTYQNELTNVMMSLERKELTFNSIGNFTTKVLFAAPEQDDVMKILALVTAQLEARFVEEGLIQDIGVTRPWHPHATILKTSYDRKAGNKLKINPQDFESMKTLLQNSAASGNRTHCI